MLGIGSKSEEKKDIAVSWINLRRRHWANSIIWAES